MKIYSDGTGFFSSRIWGVLEYEKAIGANKSSGLVGWAPFLRRKEYGLKWDKAS